MGMRQHMSLYLFVLWDGSVTGYIQPTQMRKAPESLCVGLVPPLGPANHVLEGGDL